MSRRAAGLLQAVEDPRRALLRWKPRIAMDVTGLTPGPLVLAVFPASSGPEDTTVEGTLLWATGTTDDHRVGCDVPRRQVAVRPGDSPTSASSRPSACSAGEKAPSRQSTRNDPILVHKCCDKEEEQGRANGRPFVVVVMRYLTRRSR